MNHRKSFPSLIVLLLLCTQLFSPLYAQSNPNNRSVGDKIAVVRAQGATLLDNSGQSLGVTVSAGSLLIVKGRNADSSRLWVITESSEWGWVAANSLLIVNIANLPVIEAEDSPVIDSVIDSADTEESVAQPTPTKVAAATATPKAETTPTGVTARVVSQLQRLNLRSGPSVNYAIVDKAENDSEWIAIGRNPSSDWVQLTTPETGEVVWAAAVYLTLSAPIGQLAVPTDLPVEPPTPTANPISTANITLSVVSEEPLIPLPTPTQSIPSLQPVVNNSTNRPTGLSGTLVFQDRIGGTIYVYHLATGNLHSLTGGIDPAISPDGKLVAFTRDGGDNGLFVINIDGSGERRLYDDRELLRSPKWSPDGGKIVFSRSNGYVDCRILQGKVCMPDEAIFDLLPEELQGDVVTEKAVKDLPNSRQYFFTLSRVRLDNGEFRDIASKGEAGAPDWSNGGIVYQSNNGLQRTDDQPDSDSTLIAQDIQVGNYIDPDQQPNGGRIVFQHSRGGHWQIYGVNPDGSGLAALTTLATVMVDALPSNVSPAWSPDGQQIVYLSNRNSYESAGPWHLWVMNADGSNQRRLPIEVEFTYSFGSEQMVSWGQ